MHISTIDRALLAGTIALGLAFAASQASAWPATAEACHDGDTCTVISDSGQRVTIRLHGVDASELDQPYGAQARPLINSLVAGQRVEVRPTGELSYGRSVADIVLPSGRDVSTTLVASGAAWVEQRWNHTPPPTPPKATLSGRISASGLMQLRCRPGSDGPNTPTRHSYRPAVGRSTSAGRTPAQAGARHNEPTTASRRQGQPA